MATKSAGEARHAPALPITPKYLRAADAAQYLGVAEKTLAQWRWRGGGPQYAKRGNIILYAIRDLDDWFDAAKQASTSEGV